MEALVDQLMAVLIPDTGDETRGPIIRAIHQARSARKAGDPAQAMAILAQLQMAGAPHDLGCWVHSEWLSAAHSAGFAEDSWLCTAKPGAVLFATRSLDTEAAAAEARRIGLWASRSVIDRLWPTEVQITRPLMPLRKGHLAMLIAAGFLNHLSLEARGKRVLVKGRTRKEFVLAETTDETETYREVLRTSVVALDLRSGEFTEIQA